MYSARKEVKEYLDFFAEPNENDKLEEYKRIIKEEFYPEKSRREPKTRFSVCRKAVSDFKKLGASPEYIAELMVFYMENACEFTYDYGDMWEQYYDSVEGNFDRTCRYVVAHGLFKKFEARLEQCVKWSEDCGWGFADNMADMFENAKAMYAITMEGSELYMKLSEKFGRNDDNAK